MKLKTIFSIAAFTPVFLGPDALRAEHTASAKPKVLFVLTSHDIKGSTGEPTGFYLSEATHPYKEITEAGYEVEFASPKGGKAPVDGFDLKDPVNQHFWEDATFRHGVENTLSATEVDPSRYAGIFFVGGHGAMWDLPQNTALASAAAAIYEKGGVVGAVCHGPAGLINVKLSNGTYLVAGKDVAAFTNSEEAAVKLDKVIPFFLADSLVEHGAKHHSAANFEKKVVVSDRLITGQNPASASGVGEEMVKLLNAKR